MTTLRKLFLYLTVGVIVLVGGIGLFLRLVSVDKTDDTKRIAECGLSSINGETLSIHQGTVGRVFEMSIGLQSVENNKANVQFWNASANISGLTLTLGLCESADFEEYTVYILAIKDVLGNPLGGPGSGSDSVEVFVRKH